jgi:hypothetical protein
MSDNCKDCIDKAEPVTPPPAFHIDHTSEAEALAASLGMSVSIPLLQV